MSNTVYTIREQTLDNIANAIRSQRVSTGAMSPLDMPAEIGKISGNINIDTDVSVIENYAAWSRPLNWPDLDSLTLPNDFDGFYMTYDLSKTDGYGWIGLYVDTTITASPNNTYTIERGHISNGAFVADYSTTQARNTYFRQTLDANDGTIQLWRVISNGHIKRFGFVPNTGTNAQNMHNYLQPCVERKGVLPYVTSCASTCGTTNSYVCEGTAWLEKDNLVIGTSAKVTSLSGMYQNCYRLRRVNLNWDTSGWNVGNLGAMFTNCYVLDDDQFDFSSWDTSNWVTTNVSSMFAYCLRLRTARLTYFTTTKWAITTLASMFDNCSSLTSVQWSNWTTTNWNVTAINSMFSGCRNIKQIDFSHWNTASWHVTAMQSMFANCFNLTDIDLHYWNTATWAVSNMAQMFYRCRACKKINTTGWVTTNWAVNSLYYLFADCHSLQELDLSHWNTTSWVVGRIDGICSACYKLEKLIVPWTTTNWPMSGTNGRMNSAFANCFALQSLDFRTWNTSGWGVRYTSSMFANCFSLIEIKGISTWNTSNWNVIELSYMFQGCHSLRTLDVSGWNTSNWAPTNLNYLFDGCYSLKEIIGLNSWDTSNWAVTTMAYMFQFCQSLKTIDISSWDVSNFAVTSFSTIISYSYALETFLVPAALSGLKVTNTGYIFSSVPGIKERTFWSANIAINISGDICISKASINNLISKLATLTSTKTLTLGQNNKLKMTSAELAVATQKGWTIA